MEEESSQLNGLESSHRPQTDQRSIMESKAGEKTIHMWFFIDSTNWKPKSKRTRSGNPYTSASWDREQDRE